MNQPRFYSHFFRWCERQIVHFPWIVVLSAILLCIGTSYYVYKNLTVNTNSAEMLSPDLPFQQNQRRIDKAFQSKCH
jgi:predicted RND superfamily exporter protein